MMQDLYAWTFGSTSNQNFHNMLGNASWTFLLITCLYKICFYNVRFIGSNDGPFTIQGNEIATKGSTSNNVDFSRELLDTWISW